MYQAFLVAQLVKESACNAGDRGSIPGLGRSPGEGNGYPPPYSGLENFMKCMKNFHGVTQSWTRLKRLSSSSSSSMENSALDSILKSRDITLPTKVRLVKAMVFQ